MNLVLTDRGFVTRSGFGPIEFAAGPAWAYTYSTLEQAEAVGRMLHDEGQIAAFRVVSLEEAMSPDLVLPE